MNGVVVAYASVCACVSIYDNRKVQLNRQKLMLSNVFHSTIAALVLGFLYLYIMCNMSL